MIGWMLWLGIANANTQDLDLALSVGDASVEVVFGDFEAGETRLVELGEVSASFELAGSDLRITVKDARGRELAAPSIEIGSGSVAKLTTPTALGLLRVHAQLRDARLAGEGVRCEALRGPTAAELEASIGRVAATGGTANVFAGPATVRVESSSTTGPAIWVCSLPR